MLPTHRTGESSCWDSIPTRPPTRHQHRPAEASDPTALFFKGGRRVWWARLRAAKAFYDHNRIRHRQMDVPRCFQ